MADAKQLDLLEILEHLDAQLDSSLESSLEIRLQRVTNAMRECTGASAAWINWVLPRHRRRTGEVGKGVTSPNISADFAAIAESTRTLGSITQPGTYRLSQSSWAAAPLAISPGEPFGVFGMGYEDTSEMPVHAAEVAHWIASRLDSEIHALSIGETLHQFNTELDHCCDQNDIQLALSTCLETYREYSRSESVALIYCAPGHTAHASDTLGLLIGASDRKTFTVSADEYQALVESPNQEKAFETLLQHNFETSLSQILVERNGQENKPFGFVIGMGAKHRYRDPVERQLLQTLAMRLDSRLTNFHLLKLKLCRFIDARVASQIAIEPDRYDQILKPRRQTIAMLYADIVGFSRLSEIHSGDLIAQITTEFLNAFQQIVFKRRGIYDKAVGDCGIALFGFPLEQK